MTLAQEICNRLHKKEGCADTIATARLCSLAVTVDPPRGAKGAAGS